jgi:hypothetical protein
MAVATEKLGPTLPPRAYIFIAGGCLLITLAGFAPTYWLPLARGTREFSPLVHAHGIVFFAWLALFVYQAWLAASGRLVRHRSVGVIGVSLVTAMLILGVAAAIHSALRVAAAGFAAEGRTLMIVPVSSIVAFAVLFAIAVKSVHRPEVHKRLITIGTVSLLGPALARIAGTLAGMTPGQGAVPPPVELSLVPGLATDLLSLGLILWDWRKRGRPHPAYIWSALALLLMHLIRVPFSKSDAWHSAAVGLMAFGS